MTVDDLYQDYETALRRFARSLARDPHRGEDLVQETFLRAMANLELLGLLAEPQRRAWLFRTLKNLFLDQERARRREDALVEALQIDWLVRRGSRAERPLADPLAIVQDPFSLVPERFRDVVEKRYVQGLSSAEIGRQLGIPAATVRSRLYLALKEMRAQSWKLRHAN